MARVAEQLVGRAAELHAVDGVLSGLPSGEPASLAVIGEPGIGKSRLLAELAARGDERGFVVLSGSASELELDLPFSVFVVALDEYVAGLHPRHFEALEGDVRVELAQVLPSLSGIAAGAGEPARQDERYRAHRAVSVLLERLSASKPLVLVLDDVHWADSGSIELIGALLRRPPSAGVLLAMAARPRQLPGRLAAAFERAVRAGGLHRVELNGLSRDEAVQLLGKQLEGAPANDLYEESGGNPFYLEQLTRATRQAERQAAPGAQPAFGGVDVPAGVAAALTEELGLLAGPTRKVLEGAAVAGDPFEPELAAAAAAVEEEQAYEALDELLALDLVRRTEVPRRFRFRHPLVRRAVYEIAPGGWRLGAHERCAKALAGRGASAPARAHHVEYAARPGDGGAVELLRDAGRATAPRAPASAVRWFGAALRLLPSGAPPQERVELLLARAEALTATGRLEEARADLLESIELVPEELEPVRVKLTVGCAGVEHMLGRHREARVRVHAALARSPDTATPDGVSLILVLAFDGLFRSDFEAMRQAAERALATARPLGQAPLTAMAAAVLALGCAFGGEVACAEAARSEAAELIDALSDEALAQRLDAAAHLATAELYLDRFEDSRLRAERALAVGRATGQHFPTLIPTLGTVYFMLGRLADAARVIEGSVEAARLANNLPDIAWGMHIRSSALLASGDVEPALSTAEEAVELTRDLDESFVSAYPGMALAAALLPAGEPQRAIEVLLARAGGDELSLIPGGWSAAGFELLTRCHIELSDVDQAASTAARAREVATAIGLPMATAWAERASAAVALESGDFAAAAETAIASAAAADGAGAVIEGALSRTLAGQALARAGDADAAAGELERAANVFEAWGAQRYQDAAERELRKFGRRFSRRARMASAGDGSLDSLSERELQVARLLVDRRTNREIADELFVSLKTVETHVRNLFRKLSVNSRVEVARAVERAERAERV
ncbi:MAG TPA: AAA family ATPase [Thermoleophilaceae bacterium]|nr:AAA family ATPase [Thermoleophilaceae bacterium]